MSDEVQARRQAEAAAEAVAEAPAAYRPDIDFEKELFEAAVNLRGTVAPADSRPVVVTQTQSARCIVMKVMYHASPMPKYYSALQYRQSSKNNLPVAPSTSFPIRQVANMATIHGSV